MTHAIQTATTPDFPRDARTGLTLPLRTSLGLQDLSKHRAMVALELDVLATKQDRFGWSRDRGTPTQDRLITDWMDALQDYPITEVRAACKACVMDRPSQMPNEGHVVAQIMKARALYLVKNPVRRDVEQFSALSVSVEDRKRQSAEIMAQVGFRPKGFSEGAAQ
jgi:hypothetical protein